LAAANSPAARASMVYARTTATPASRSWTSVDSTSSRSCVARVRAVTAPLNRRTSSTSAGTGAMAHTVSHTSTASIAASAPTKASAVETPEMTPKPASERTVATSLVARVMRSPVE
jgi:hypothetical protein